MLKTINNIAKEITEFPNKWRAELYSWVGRLHIVKINIRLNLIVFMNFVINNKLIQD